MRKRLILFSLVLVSARIISPGQELIYDLKDCISTGLERNFSILVARNSEVISGNNFTPGNAGFLPYITAGSRYSGSLTNTTQNLSDGTHNVTTGATSQSASAYASLSLNIFSGFSVLTTYRKLSELKQLGELNTQLTIENYLATIISVYYNYVQQVQRYNNLLYALELSRERLRIDEDRYLLGSGSKLQLLQSRVYLNSDSSLLAKQELVLRETQIRLNELMAVENVGSDFCLRDTNIFVRTDFLYEKLLEQTLRSNSSLLIAAKNKVVSEYDRKIIVSRTYPYLDLTGGYTYGFSKSSTASYNSQFTSGPNVGLTLGINIFDGFNLNRQIKNSVLEIKNKELKYAEVEQSVRADLLAIYSAYANNLRLITMEEQNLETATENLSIALERYKLGNLSGIDLREVQKSLLDARERLLSVMYQAKLAEISLCQISGTIMSYYK
jgi:outer membrane protein TolC